MGRITEDLIRRRAEHNEGMVSTLEEVALHQQNLEKIELLGHICPHLKILYLQNNLISKIQNLHKLKELEYINLAVNNVTKIQNLQRCESLKKLDLTINFVSKAGLLSLDALQHNINLKELYLLGNPCADWAGYRQYVIATLPGLQKLDGQDIKHSERIAAQQILAQLQSDLKTELIAEGIDPDKAAEVEDDSLFDEDAEIPETGYIDEKGDLRRPWCPATRILEHRENEKANREADEKKAKARDQGDPADGRAVRHTAFPEVKEGEKFFQRNEGKWEFSMEESSDRASICLRVDFGKFLDTSLIQTDLQPTYVRLLVKGKLLQLQLPCEVKPDAATAQRSALTGELLIMLPKEHPEEAVLDVAHLRPSNISGAADASKAKHGTKPHITPQLLQKKGGSDFLMKEIRKAAVTAMGDDDDDDDFVPDL